MSAGDDLSLCDRAGNIDPARVAAWNAGRPAREARERARLEQAARDEQAAREAAEAHDAQEREVTWRILAPLVIAAAPPERREALQAAWERGEARLVAEAESAAVALVLALEVP